jgi:murein DD-endopeptidase MepM/ murein hydrolase activator NlpD
MENYREINGSNARMVKKGAMIKQGQVSGKVIEVERIETFGFKLHTFTLSDKKIIKVIESMM